MATAAYQWLHRFGVHRFQMVPLVVASDERRTLVVQLLQARLGPLLVLVPRPAQRLPLYVVQQVPHPVLGVFHRLGRACRVKEGLKPTFRWRHGLEHGQSHHLRTYPRR